ncbi:MFS transporter [Rhodopila sp.]|jgi:MFS family permease|uniref:MFS transporter n=1 Tax=Rhodopila sp. TaxID=2480087 RepID=UPI002B8B9AB1|nr:MFS transporter [Rhodopila sp.]HVZ06522.1 MFS transporter [Rhodopila sp.]
MNRNVWLLFVCQALTNAVMSGQTIMASLVGYHLSGSALNTLPMAIQMVAVMGASIVAGYAFPRLGRRGGFWLACAIMMSGSLTFAAGVYLRNFPLYCAGAIPAGLGFGIAQHLRFAASEVATPEAKARAISLVLAGGLIAAVVGPEMVKRTNALIPDYPFLATYLYLPVLPVLTMVLLAFVEVPPTTRTIGVKVPFKAIVGRPNFVAAVVSSLAGYGAMNLVMASTPLEMMLCGFGVAASADVIRAHSISMYAPGFVTGRLIQRVGVHRIILVGAALILGCVAVNLYLAPLFSTFMIALGLLGVGWNFMFVGGTTLLTTAYLPEERVRVQATHDFIVFGSVAGTAVTSGAIQALYGWDALNLTALPPVAIAAVVVLWHWAAKPRPAVARA